MASVTESFVPTITDDRAVVFDWGDVEWRLRREGAMTGQMDKEYLARVDIIVGEVPPLEDMDGAVRLAGQSR